MTVEIQKLNYISKLYPFSSISLLDNRENFFKSESSHDQIIFVTKEIATSCNQILRFMKPVNVLMGIL